MTAEQITEARALLDEIKQRAERLDEIIDTEHRTNVRKRYGMSAWQRLLRGAFDLDSALATLQRSGQVDRRAG